MKTAFLAFSLLISKACTQENKSSPVQDIEGNTYKTITIGKSERMTENLPVTRYKEGSIIPNITYEAVWSTTKNEAYNWYDNAVGNRTKYGSLNNWYAVKTRNLCPDGWRVPSGEDRKYLEG